MPLKKVTSKIPWMPLKVFKVLLSKIFAVLLKNQIVNFRDDKEWVEIEEIKAGKIVKQQINFHAYNSEIFDDCLGQLAIHTVHCKQILFSYQIFCIINFPYKFEKKL